MDDVTLELAGRRFIMSPRTTVRQDTYCAAIVRASGFGEGSRHVARLLNEGASASEAVQALILGMYESGHLFDLLGGLFVPEGEKFAEATARQTAEFLADLTEHVDKTRLRDAMAGVLLGFFTNALVSSRTSPTSSDATSPEPSASADSTTSPTLPADAPMDPVASSEDRGSTSSESLPTEIGMSSSAS
jgi:hypothetical protein